ncbi:hypothetical protein [Streptomyces sp. NPDC020917]|uniref:hypothetical protein n=1 Tax=Streptomyces sp. NPDC020917 TaxID=3365102 RepID=UPI0037BAE5CB
MRRFLAGETAVQRDVFRGKVWSRERVRGIAEFVLHQFVLHPGAGGAPSGPAL